MRVLAQYPAAGYRHYCIFRLSLFVEVALAFIRARVPVVLLIVIFAAGEAITFLLLLVGPCKHHVPQCYNQARPVPSKVSI